MATAHKEQKHLVFFICSTRIKGYFKDLGRHLKDAFIKHSQAHQRSPLSVVMVGFLFLGDEFVPSGYQLLAEPPS